MTSMIHKIIIISLNFLLLLEINLNYIWLFNFQVLLIVTICFVIYYSYQYYLFFHVMLCYTKRYNAKIVKYYLTYLNSNNDIRYCFIATTLSKSEMKSVANRTLTFFVQFINRKILFEFST